MKEQKWDSSIEDAKEFFDASLLLPDEDSEIKMAASGSNTHITELRRRIEERIDSKRIAHEFDDEFDYDEPVDGIQ